MCWLPALLLVIALCPVSATEVLRHPEAAAHDAAAGGEILMLGDSIFDLHEGNERIEVVLEQLLHESYPQAHWMIANEAHGGEYIGPKEGNPTGTSGPLFTTDTTGRYFEIMQRHHRADVIFVNYGANDGKVYSPRTFRKHLERLASQLERDYPGAVLIFSTTMYVDPKHSGRYVIGAPKVHRFKNGSTRNLYLEPYNKEIRKFAAAHHYRLADIFRRIEQETKKGNWDLRQRNDEGDPRDDAMHQWDLDWFGNIHPNPKGTRVIADLLLQAMTNSH